MIDQYPPSNGVLTSLIWRKTMSGGETSLSGYDNASQALSYTPGQEQVYLNGILLVRGDDYTATNGTSITGLSALSASDFVQVNCYNNFSVASVPTTSLTGTVSNAQLANSSITINGSAVSLGGSVTLAGDIESVTAGTGLTGGGNSGAVTVSLDTTSQFVVPSQATHSGKYLTTNGTTSSWGTVDLSGKTDKSTLTTTGDIYYASAANTPARLGIGSTGQVLKVNSGLPSWQNEGAAWTSLATGNLSGNVTSLTGITKNELILIINQAKCPASGDGPLTLGMNGNTGYQAWQWDSYYSVGRIAITHYLGGTASSGIGHIALYIPNAQTTLMKPVLAVGNTGYGATYNIGGTFNLAETISSLQIAAVGSATFTEGTYALYGR